MYNALLKVDAMVSMRGPVQVLFSHSGQKPASDNSEAENPLHSYWQLPLTYWFLFV